jgi:hypothetical protein
MPTDTPYLPLSSVLPEGVWPDVLAEAGTALDDIACLHYADGGDSEKRFVSLLARVMTDVRLRLPFLTGVELSLGKGDTPETGLITADFELNWQPDGPPTFSIRLETTTLSLSFDPAVLAPVDITTEGGRLKVVKKPGRVGIPLPFALIVAYDGDNWTIDFDLPADVVPLSLPLCMIGDTGVVLKADGLSLNFTGNGLRPTGAGAGWRGVYLEAVKVYVPELFDGSFEAKKFGIGTGGLYGEFAIDFPLAFDRSRRRFTGDRVTPLFGIEGGFRRVAMAFRQNIPTAFEIKLGLLLPFFDEAVDVSVAIDAGGRFTVAIDKEDGLLTLDKQGILSLKLESLGFGVEAGKFSARLSGELTPKFGELAWPGFRVRELAIDSQGNVRLDGGWLNLRDQYSLDFYGFRLDITKIGFGKSPDGGRWVGFSGGLKLIDGLAAGASVEGLRVTWYDDGRPVKLSLSGVGVEFDVPDTIYFKGTLAYDPSDHQFKGAIRLLLRTLGLSVDGQLIIGAKDGQRYMAIYLGLELPAGIPLGATGLGLYGFAGLFAVQWEPNKAQKEPWYSIDQPIGWYQTKPDGVAVLDKWGYRRDSFALGVGVTLGTVADNGFTFNGRMLLVLVLPGPILLIEGRANILSERASLSSSTAEPKFRALVVLDGRAGSFLIGLDARYKVGGGGELIDIAGSAEAFFDFHDANAWHIFLGIDQPRERRIRARLFKIFESNAYFMLSPKELKLGAWVGYDLKLDFGPVHVGLEAWIEGGAKLSFRPIHFYGFLWLHGKIEASVFGFGFHLGANARLEAEVFDPFHLLALIDVSIGLPWPLPDFDFTIKLEWGPDPVPPPLPLVLKEVALEHLKSTLTYPLPKAAGLLTPDFDAGGGFLKLQRDGKLVPLAPAGPPDPDKIPVVPLDARPHLTFNRSVADTALIGVNAQMTPEWEWIGDTSAGKGAAHIGAALTGLALDRLVNGTWVQVSGSGEFFLEESRRLYGSWAPVPAFPDSTPAPNTPSPVGQVKLFLWSKSPFDYTRHTQGGWDQWFTDNYREYPCIPSPGNQEVCVDFDASPDGVRISPPFTPTELQEASLGWSGCLPRACPVQTMPKPVHGRNKALRFPPGSELVFQVQARGRGAVQSLQLLFEMQGEPALGKRVCTNFPAVKPPAGNSLTDAGATFTTYHGASPTPPLLASVALQSGAVEGLEVPSRVEIIPSFMCKAVELTLYAPGGAGEGRSGVMAYAPGGFAVDAIVLPEGTQVPTRFTLTAPTGRPITRVVFWVSGAKGLLVEACFQPVSSVEVFGVRVGVDGSETLDPIPLAGGRADVPTDEYERVLTRIWGQGDGETVGLVGWCARLGMSKKDQDRLSQLTKHLQDETVQFQSSGFVLEPWSLYRLRVRTVLRVDQCPVIPDFRGDRVANEVAYFRTEGPPGVTRLKPPRESPTADHFDSGLDDLTRYVDQTIPPTVANGPGGRPLLPRPVYRGYDVGLRFNVDYVDQMYRSAGRDLRLYLFDNNNRPARDSAGRLLVYDEPWGKADEVSRSSSEVKWIRKLNSSTCDVRVDLSKVTTALALTTSKQILSADTLYEARLIPRLLHEAFLRYAPAQSATGDGALLPQVNGVPGWAVTDETMNGAPSIWQIGHEVVPERGQQFFVSQMSGIGDAGNAIKRKLGTLLVCQQPVGVSPDSWDDYVVRCIVRPAAASGAIGLQFRRCSATGYYAVVLDDALGKRRLLRVNGAETVVLAEEKFHYVPGSDHALTVEAIGPRLRVSIQVTGLDQAVFDVIDTVHMRGGIALYAWRCPKVRFADVTVDDFRAAAPVAYRFGFTSSRFINFFHHLHSYSDVPRTVPLSAADQATVAQAVAAAARSDTPKPTEEDPEGRGFHAIAAKALGPSSNQDAPAVEAIHLTTEEGTAAVLLRTGEPIDWGRTELKVSWAPLPVGAPRTRPDPPVQAKIIRAAASAGGGPNDEVFELTATVDLSLNGWRLEYRTFPGRAAAGAGVTVFTAAFSGPPTSALAAGDALWRPTLTSMREWTIRNPVGPPGAWSATAGVLTQVADSGVRQVTPGAESQRGTLAVGGDPTWTDIAVRAELASSDEDAFGLLFRYRDENNYYCFSLDRRNNRRRLVRVAGGAFTVLDEAPGGFDLSNWTRAEVRAVGPRLVCIVDDTKVVAATDLTHRAGQVGAYCWRNSGANFRHFVVTDARPRLGDWVVRDEDAPAQAAWWIGDRTLVQVAKLRALPAADDPAVSSSRLHLTRDVGGDYVVRALVELDSGNTVGLLFRCQTTDGSRPVAGYGFYVSTQAPGRRLVRRDGDTVNTLYQDSTQVVAGAVVELKVEATGSRLRGYVDGIPAFDLLDSGVADGGVGLACFAGSLKVHAYEVTATTPEWSPYYTFGPGDRLDASGRLFVRGGRAADPTTASPDHGVVLWAGMPPDRPGSLRLPSDGFEARLVPAINALGQVPGHRRIFLPDAAFVPLDARVLRRPDGTGTVICLPRAGAPAGTRIAPGLLRLVWAFRRDGVAPALSQSGDISPEEATLDVVVP